jgi:hypothetical protein
LHIEEAPVLVALAFITAVSIALAFIAVVSIVVVTVVLRSPVE